ncbi:MAG TPA: 1-(5-phosphoribosyl)-5-[(5-phosphoribosylamino)methylideneamino]imidazole-4-carboxamide isomerase, partial [Cytophagaceae bacterium]
MIKIIPAIDIIDGKCVRLTQGDFLQKKKYHDDPLEVAKTFQDAGITNLHLVDLDGARQKHIVNHKVLEAIASKTSLKVDFGGGLQSDDDLRIAFECGAAQITGGSIAVREPVLFESWINNFGSEKIILGADAKDGKIAVSGWQEITKLHIFDFIEDYLNKGIKYVLCTDISKDGLLQGPSFDLYKEILERFPNVKLIASGGVTTIKDIEKLEELGLYGAIIGKAYYEGHIKLTELSKFI